MEHEDQIAEPQDAAQGGAKPPTWLLILYGGYAVWATAYLCLYWLGD